MTCGFLPIDVYEVRLLLPSFAQEFLNEVNLAPTQLAPNGWGMLYGCYYLWWNESEQREREGSSPTELLMVDQMLGIKEWKGQ